MSDKDDLIRELIQISREHGEADQSMTKVLLILAGCWITSLVVILVAGIDLQGSWGLFMLIFSLGGVFYLLFDLVNHTLSLRSNVQKVGAMLSYILNKDS